MPSSLLLPCRPDLRHVARAAVRAATRREFLAVLASSGLLAACGGGSDAAESAGRAVDHVLGSSVIPPLDAIRSVVVIEGRRDLETALALDLPVVGAPSAIPQRALPGTPRRSPGRRRRAVPPG